MNIKKLLTLLSFILLGIIAFAQDTGPKKYIPTEIQSLRLQVRQKDALIAQQEVNRAQAQFNSVMAALNEEVNRVKAENKWEDRIIFDVATLTFRDPVPPTPPQPPAAPPVKKP